MFDLYNTHLWCWEFTLQCAPFNLLFYPTMRMQRYDNFLKWQYVLSVFCYSAHFLIYCFILQCACKVIFLLCLKLFSLRVLFDHVDHVEFGILEVLDARVVRPYNDGIKNNRVG